MSSSYSSTFVDGFRSQYKPKDTLWGEGFLALHSKGPMYQDGYMGSFFTVSIACDREIVIDAPGCIVAPLVHLVSKTVLDVGSAGQRDQKFPVRILAERQISFTAPIVTIGDVRILKEPCMFASISCKKLNLVIPKGQDEPPACFEVVRSWVVNDAEVEVIKL